MRRKLGKETLEFQFFQDYWKFTQDFYCVGQNENTNEFFEQMVDAGNELFAKYSDTYLSDFVKTLVVAKCTEVDHRDKNFEKYGRDGYVEPAQEPVNNKWVIGATKEVEEMEI